MIAGQLADGASAAANELSEQCCVTQNAGHGCREMERERRAGNSSGGVGEGGVAKFDKQSAPLHLPPTDARRNDGD